MGTFFSVVRKINVHVLYKYECYYIRSCKVSVRLHIPVHEAWHMRPRRNHMHTDDGVLYSEVNAPRAWLVAMKGQVTLESFVNCDQTDPKQRQAQV